MYKFTPYENGITLVSKRWTVTVKPVKGHIEVSMTGPNNCRKTVLSAVKDDLTKFEMKVVALHFYREFRRRADFEYNELRHTNYADIFGSCFE